MLPEMERAGFTGELKCTATCAEKINLRQWINVLSNILLPVVGEDYTKVHAEGKYPAFRLKDAEVFQSQRRNESQQGIFLKVSLEFNTADLSRITSRFGYTYGLPISFVMEFEVRPEESERGLELNQGKVQKSIESGLGNLLLFVTHSVDKEL